MREHLVRIDFQEQRRESIRCPVSFETLVIDDIGGSKCLVERQILGGLRHLNAKLLNKISAVGSTCPVEPRLYKGEALALGPF